MKYRSWLVYRQGKRFATMVGHPKDRETALLFARSHWRDSDVKPNERSVVAA